MSKFIYLAMFVLASCQNMTSQKTPQSNKESVAPAITVKKEARQIEHSSPKLPEKTVQNYPYDINLKDADGNAYNSKDVFKVNDKPTVILFWLTTCYPCRMEMKAINGKYEKWQSETDFNFYAISTDWKKNEAKFVKMVKDNNWPWQVYWDVNKAFRNVMPGKLNGLPQVFLLDKNGEIVLHKRKYTTGDEDKLYEKIKEYASK